MRAVILRGFGGAGQLSFGAAAKPVLSQTGEVLLRSRAAGINRADVLQRQGKYPPPPGVSELLGLEIAGEVVESRSPLWSPGDRCMALLAGGGYGEFCVVNEATCMPVPHNLDFVSAAAVPEAWITAYQLLRFVAGSPLRGESHEKRRLLVHAAASGVGSAALQLAGPVFGFDKVIATASSEVKLEFCRGLGATDAFSYKDGEPLDRRVLEATGGAGVDVVLDPVAGPLHFPASLKCCAQDAAYVLFAAMAGAKLTNFSLAPFLLKRVRLLGTTLRGRDLEYKRRLVQGFSVDVLPLLERGSLRPVVDRVFPVEEAHKAHEHMDANLTMGKVVLEWAL